MTSLFSIRHASDVRRRTIYEYHKVDIPVSKISRLTAVEMLPLPSKLFLFLIPFEPVSIQRMYNICATGYSTIMLFYLQKAKQFLPPHSLYVCLSSQRVCSSPAVAHVSLLRLALTAAGAVSYKGNVEKQSKRSYQWIYHYFRNRKCFMV